MIDLMAHLTEAAAVAIANERSSLEHAPKTIRRVTIELMVGGDGQLGQCVGYVERHGCAQALLARQRKEVAG